MSELVELGLEAGLVVDGLHDFGHPLESPPEDPAVNDVRVPSGEGSQTSDQSREAFLASGLFDGHSSGLGGLTDDLAIGEESQRVPDWQNNETIRIKIKIILSLFNRTQNNEKNNLKNYFSKLFRLWRHEN